MKVLTADYVRQKNNPPPQIVRGNQVVKPGVQSGVPAVPAVPNVPAVPKATPKPPVKVDETYVTGFKATPMTKLRSMELMELYTYYMKLVTVPTIKCNQVVRYGNKGDGGWEICQDEVYKVKAPCLVYSMGINWDFSFDDAVSGSAGCVVHSFDPSMKTKSFNRSNLVRFHNYGLKGEEVSKGKQFVDQTPFILKNFDDILTSLNHRESTIDYFKMDIEGPEWKSMDLMLSRGLMSHVRQFAFEVHVFQWEFNKEMFIRSINLLERMREAGFELYLTHKNPMGIYMNPKLRKNISCCYELYYLNTKYRIGKGDKK